MIREMKENDLDEVLVIEKSLFNSPWNKEQFLYELNDNDLGNAYVYELDNKIIGYGMLWYLFENADITNLAIKKEYQNKGYGKELLKFLLIDALKNDCEFVHLEVRVNNDNAINLYKKFGFEIIRTRKAYYEDGSDAYDMIKGIGGLNEKDFSD